MDMSIVVEVEMAVGWPRLWDLALFQAVTVPLGPDSFAGFSVVRGRDQPQLPNPILGRSSSPRSTRVDLQTDS